MREETMTNQSSSWLGKAESALRAAAPTRLFSTARSLLATYVDARHVNLLLADYGLTVLQPVTHLPQTGEEVSVHGEHPAGRAFSTQAPVVEVTADPGMVTVHLPITVRGDQLGVLSVHLPEPAKGTPAVLELAAFATAIGHELLVAERDTDLYLQGRRRRRLTLAAEMQWQLLPGRGFTQDEYTLGAHLEPAYAIGGDNFDWTTTDDHLTITVSDGKGTGLQAAPGHLRRVRGSPVLGDAPAALRSGHRAGSGGGRGLPTAFPTPAGGGGTDRTGPPDAAGHVRGD
jgi:hypothetical protein